MEIFPNRHAFLIAIESYNSDGISSLKTPSNDAKDIGDSLRENCGFITHHCVPNPTRAQLTSFLSEIEQTLEDAQESETQVIIYYAGHGVALDSDTRMSGYIIPSDAVQRHGGRNTLAETSVSMRALLDTIARLAARQVLLILDCCFAGMIRWSAPNSHRGLDVDPEEKLFRQQFNFYTRHKVRQVFTSSSHDQLALDALGFREERDRNSPFAHYFLRALRGKADGNKDGVAVMEEMQTYIGIRLVRVAQGINHDQTSGFFPLNDHDCGSFLFLGRNFNPVSLEMKNDSNPYMGLRTYDVKDNPFYFGRGATITGLVGEVSKVSEGSGKIIIVSGGSGSGKSSMIKAGLIPKLQGSDRIPIVVPGREPVVVLQRALQSGSEIIVIDQLEQLITQATEESESVIARFLDMMIASGKMFIRTIRTDFEVQIFKGRDLSVPPFAFVRLEGMKREHLHEIIVNPAMQAGRFFYPESLVDTIIDDFLHYPNALPLLSLVLYELYERCRKDQFHEITETEYAKVGGLSGVLQHKLDALYNDLALERERAMLQNILFRLTSFTSGKVTSRRVFESELNFGSTELNTLRDKVVNSLESNDYRLITKGKEHAGEVEIDRKFIEPAHDYVIQTLGNRDEWINAVRNGDLVRRGGLSEAVNEYQKHKRATYLWSNDYRLLEIGERPRSSFGQFKWDWQPFTWSFKNQLQWFTEAEISFTKKSFQGRQIGKAFAQILKFSIGIALLVVAFLINQQLDLVQKNLLSLQLANLSSKTTDKTLALQAAYKLQKINPQHPDVITLLSDALSERHYFKSFSNLGTIKNVFFSNDAQFIFIGDDSRRLKILDWKREGIFRILASKDDDFSISVLSPNDKQLIAAGPNGDIRLWDWRTGKMLGSLPANGGGVIQLDISEDGNYLVSTSKDRSVKIWELKTRKQVLKIDVARGDGGIVKIDMTPDNKLLLVATEDVVRVFEKNGGKVVIEKYAKVIDEISGKSFKDAAFLDNRKITILGSRYDNSQYVHVADVYDDVTTIDLDGQRESSFSFLNNAIVHGLYFDSGRRGMLLQRNGGVMELMSLYDTDGKLIASPQPLTDELIASKVSISLKGNSGGIAKSMFSKTNRYFLTLSGNGDIRVWDLSPHYLGESIAKVSGNGSQKQRGIVGALNKYDYLDKFILSGKDTIWFYSKTKDGRYFAAALSPNGKSVVALKYEDDGAQRLEVWDLASGKINWSSVGGEGQSALFSMPGYQLSPDKKYFVSTSPNSSIDVFDWDSGIVIQTIPSHSFDTLFLSTSGRDIFTENDSVIYRWERFETYIEDPEMVNRFSYTDYYVNGINAYLPQKVMVSAEGNYNDLIKLAKHFGGAAGGDSVERSYWRLWCLEKAVEVTQNQSEGEYLEQYIEQFKKAIGDDTPSLPKHLWWSVQRCWYRLVIMWQKFFDSADTVLIAPYITFKQ